MLAACATLPPPPRAAPATSSAGADTRSVLLVSLDGFRADYFDLGITPNLARIASEGIRARWMTPVFPSLTFPNHYSLVTGLVPDHHGIVHNSMRDPELGEFKLSNRIAVAYGRWWGGEPIWIGAEKAGLRSATMYWPGSEAAIGGLRPTRWHRYIEGQNLSLEARVDTVLGWLAEPEHTRPRIATLYFETIDKAGHEHGPESTQAHAAVRRIDAVLGRLLHGLDARGLRDRVDLIVVSDHGMASVAAHQAIAIEDLVGPDEADVASVGQVIGIEPKRGFEQSLERKLLGTHQHYACWRKQQLPSQWRYGTHPRIPTIVCQMDEGWNMLPRAVLAKRTSQTRGAHGYDPSLASMRALFVARGPSFKSGVLLAPIAAIDVYPLLARLLGISPAPNDGNSAALQSALRDPEAPHPAR